MQNKLTLLSSCILFISASSFHFKTENGQLTKYYVHVPGNGLNPNSFYISSIEVTNKQYRDFLNDLRAKGETDKLQKAMVDTSKWDKTLPQPAAFTGFYFQNAAFNEYPVVNVSKEGANLYCKWLTEKYNSSAKTKVQFTLPTEEQWKQAAQGGDNDATYPWKGNTLTYEKKGKSANASMCNYRREKVPARAGNANNEKADITAPSMSFMPNAYGIYNMSGNVAELLADKNYTKGGSWYSPADKVTINAKEEFYDPTGSGPTIGFRPVMIIGAAK